MKKAMISVAFDAEKLSAAKLYMAQKDLSFEDELERRRRRCTANMCLRVSGNSLS